MRDADPEDDEGYRTTLRAGLAEVSGSAIVRRIVMVASVLAALDTIDEYFPLTAHQWGFAARIVPLAVLGLPLAGALGAALGGPVACLSPRALCALLAASGFVLAAAGIGHRPASLLGLALFYGICRSVLGVMNAWLQDAIEGPSRATVTSVGALGTEIATLGVFGAWIAGGVISIAALTLAAALCIPFLARRQS